MTPEQLAEWLGQNVESLYAFMDYEPTIESEEELAKTLGHWFRSSFWASTKHRFIHLGIDGTGAVATSCENWAKTIAYAPAVAEYLAPGERRLDPAENWMFDNNVVGEEEADEARTLQAAYRVAMEERFGKIESLDQLRTDLEKVDAEFVHWVESVSDR